MSRTGPQAEAIGSSPVDRGNTGSKHRDGSTRLARFGAGRELHCPVPNYHPDACRSLGCPSPHEASPDVTCITFLAPLHGWFQSV
jgi:hypothetical protein